jgi:hypothetical protein
MEKWIKTSDYSYNRRIYTLEFILSKCNEGPDFWDLDINVNQEGGIVIASSNNIFNDVAAKEWADNEIRDWAMKVCQDV